MIKLLAQTLSTPFPEGFQGLGPLGGETSPGNYQVFTTTIAGFRFNRIISISIGVMTVIAGIWFIIQIFLASLQWLTAGSEKQGLQDAKKKIVNSVIGLFLVVVSYGLILMIGNILGLDWILDPASVIRNLLFP